MFGGSPLLAVYYIEVASSVGPPFVAKVGDYSSSQRKLLPALSCCYDSESQFYILLQYGSSKARISDSDICHFSCHRVTIKCLLYHVRLRRWYGKRHLLWGVLLNLLLPLFAVVDCCFCRCVALPFLLMEQGIHTITN